MYVFFPGYEGLRRIGVTGRAGIGAAVLRGEGQSANERQDTPAALYASSNYSHTFFKDANILTMSLTIFRWPSENLRARSTIYYDYILDLTNAKKKTKTEKHRVDSSIFTGPVRRNFVILCFRNNTMDPLETLRRRAPRSQLRGKKIEIFISNSLSWLNRLSTMPTNFCVTAVGRPSRYLRARTFARYPPVW